MLHVLREVMMGEWVRPVDQDLDHRHSDDALFARGTLDTDAGSIGGPGTRPYI